MKKSPKKPKTGMPQPKLNKPVPLWWWLLGILVLTWLVYLQAFNNGFTDWDDQFYVTGNLNIRSLSFQSIIAFFTSRQTQGNYHPLTMLSLAIDYAFFGLNAAGYHTVNILLHLINVCLVFVLTQKLFKNSFITIVTTLLFAIHPMHVESVAWVSERKDVLYTLFYILGLQCYCNYLDEKKRVFFAATVLCFLLSLLSKAQAVTFPIALLLIDYLRNGKLQVKNIIAQIPLLAVSALFGIIAIYAQQQVSATELYVKYNWFDRIILTGYAFAIYVLKLFVPVQLAVLYPYPDKNNGFYNLAVYLSLLIPIGYAALFWITQKNKIVICGLLFFVLNVALILQVFPVGDALVAERYTYLSYIGLFWVVAYGIYYLIQRKKQLEIATVTVLIIYTALLSCATYQHTQVWHDSYSLWYDEVDKFNNAPVAWNNLGMLKENDNDPKTAKEYFSKAISLDPNYALSYSNRSMAYTQLNMFDSAIHDDNIALKLNPNIKAAHLNRSTAYGISGKADSSLMDCDWLISHYPNDLSAHVNYGLACIAAKKYDSAVIEFNNIIYNYPDNVVAYTQRGLAYTMLNKSDYAINDYNKALELKKDNWIVYDYLAHTFFLKGDYEKAIEAATISIQNSNSTIPNDLITRAQAYKKTGNYSGALQDYLRLKQYGYTISPTLIDSLNKEARITNR